MIAISQTARPEWFKPTSAVGLTHPAGPRLFRIVCLKLRYRPLTARTKSAALAIDSRRVVIAAGMGASDPRTPGLGERIAEPTDAAVFDEWDPANISPLVAWLGTENCSATGKTFYVQGGRVGIFQSWKIADEVDKHDRWDVAELGPALEPLLNKPKA